MTREEIIRMAREAGLHLYVNDLTEEPYALIVERFAAIVAAAEREACAVIAKTPIAGEQDDITMEAKDRVAASIRARGQG